jgi:hypothetical protein
MEKTPDMYQQNCFYSSKPKNFLDKRVFRDVKTLTKINGIHLVYNYFRLIHIFYFSSSSRLFSNRQ